MIALFAEPPPPREDKAQFSGFGESGAFTETVEQEPQRLKEIEQIDTLKIKLSENKETTSVFSLDVTVITQVEQAVFFERRRSVSKLLPINTQEAAFAESERRKKYFVCLRHRCFKCWKSINRQEHYKTRRIILWNL